MRGGALFLMRSNAKFRGCVCLALHSEVRLVLECALLGPERGHQTMNRNVLYVIIGALAVATMVFGYQFYQERQKTTGIEINVGKNGISIEKK